MGAPMTDGERITQLQVRVEELEAEAKEFNQFSRDATKWIGERDRYLTALKEIEKYIYNLPKPDYCEELFHIQDIVRDAIFTLRSHKALEEIVSIYESGKLPAVKMYRVAKAAVDHTTKGEE